MEDRLVNVCYDAITILKALNQEQLANTLDLRVQRIMGYRLRKIYCIR